MMTAASEPAGPRSPAGRATTGASPGRRWSITRCTDHSGSPPPERQRLGSRSRKLGASYRLVPSQPQIVIGDGVGQWLRLGRGADRAQPRRPSVRRLSSRCTATRDGSSTFAGRWIFRIAKRNGRRNTPAPHLWARGRAGRQPPVSPWPRRFGRLLQRARARRVDVVAHSASPWQAYQERSSLRVSRAACERRGEHLGIGEVIS